MEKNKKKAILLDVDGPLNPFSAKIPPEGYQTHRMNPDSWHGTKALRVLLNPLHGRWLTNLGAEIIWATMWEHDANEWIGPHIGLPKLEVIEWPDRQRYDPRNLHYKTKTIGTWMNENRPGIEFTWIDDEVTKRDLKYLNEECYGLASTMQISPKFGIRSDDIQMLEYWMDR